MGHKNGTYGVIDYNGNHLTIDANAAAIGGIALTSGHDRVECYWDGNQWICTSIGFATSPEPNETEAAQAG